MIDIEKIKDKAEKYGVEATSIWACAVFVSFLGMAIGSMSGALVAMNVFAVIFALLLLGMTALIIFVSTVSIINKVRK